MALLVSDGLLDVGGEKWKSQAQLVDARDSVTDVKFAPKHFGLRLVSPPLVLEAVNDFVGERRLTASPTICCRRQRLQMALCEYMKLLT